MQQVQWTPFGTPCNKGVSSNDLMVESYNKGTIYCAQIS